MRRRPAALLTVLAVLASGCTAPADPPSADERTSVVAPVSTRLTLGAVRGELSKKHADKLLSRIGATVDAWFEGAYLTGDYPRTDFDDAFTGFTPRAAALARSNRTVMSNAKVGAGVDDVEAITQRVRVDVLAARQRPAAVTARVDLVLHLVGPALDRRDRIRGRLFLTYHDDGWQVFGYDIDREELG